MLSTSASLGCRTGNAIAAAVSKATPMRRRCNSGMRANGRVMTETAAEAVPFMRVALSRLAGRQPPEQTGRLEHQHQHEDREDDDVGPRSGDELPAHRLDQAD